MLDILDRKTNVFDLVLCFPGKSYLNQAKYGILVGSNTIFDIDSNLINTKKCVLIGNLTEEQEKIRQGLITCYKKYGLEKVKAGGAFKIEPEVGGVYFGNSSQYCYLYLGRYKIQYSFESSMSISKNYTEGGYCYLKFDINSYSGAKFLNYYLNKTISKKEFKNFMWKYCCIGGSLGLYGNNLRSEDLNNFVISTKKRSFTKKYGEISIENFDSKTKLIWTMDDYLSGYQKSYMQTYKKDLLYRSMCLFPIE